MWGIRCARNTKNVHKGNYGSTNKFERASIHKRLDYALHSYAYSVTECVWIKKKNDILPLPCVRTIRRYLSTVNIKWFDKHFCEIFKKYIEKKRSLQKHGLLLIDEISLWESISVNSSNLIYKGFVDFGEDGKKAKSLDEKAV